METASEFPAIMVGKYFATVTPVSPDSAAGSTYSSPTSAPTAAAVYRTTGAQRDTEQPDHGEIGARKNHRAQHTRVAEAGHRNAVGEREPPGEEGGERDQFAEDQRHRAEDARLGGEEQGPVRDRGECGADRAGGVLAGDHEHAEYADDQLAEGDPGQHVVHRVVCVGLVRALGERGCWPWSRCR
ncbi:hypothetical protein [Streptomyces sp. NBC_00147]|uniref:hypothetical protein n=1 Tax=Streptomyces sp. NBC_00147 TaxID=2975667 RepID=UPI00324B952F